MEIASSLHQIERVSGDRHVVRPRRRGVTLAVIDRIGHGPEAATAADLAWRSHRQHLADHVLEKNFQGNDDALVLLARFKEPDDE